MRGQDRAWLLSDDFAKGYTRAYSLDPDTAGQTADFLLYSSLTTVARRPDQDYSWTINWPAEPLVGNTPTTGDLQVDLDLVHAGVLRHRRGGGDLPHLHRAAGRTSRSGPVAGTGQISPPTPSQRALWKYFLVVAAVLLVQILAGSIMAHYYTERAGFYGIGHRHWLPFAFLRKRAPAVADRVDRRELDRRGPVPGAPDRRA